MELDSSADETESSVVERAAEKVGIERAAERVERRESCREGKDRESCRGQQHIGLLAAAPVQCLRAGLRDRAGQCSPLMPFICGGATTGTLMTPTVTMSIFPDLTVTGT